MAKEPNDTKTNDSGTKPDGSNALETALEKERARAQEAENQLKALRVEMAKIKKDDDASKSEMEKLAERIAAQEKRADQAEARALRAEVAAEKKLTPAQSKRLQGTTRAELEADADELLEAFGTADNSNGNGSAGKPAKPAGVPNVRGDSSNGDNDTTDYSKAAESILGG